MTQLCRKMFHFNIKRRILWRVSILRRYLRSIFSRFLACCSAGKSSVSYRQLSRATTAVSIASPSIGVHHQGFSSIKMVSSQHSGRDYSSSDLVPVKISLFGDSQIGKTSFLKKYIGEEKSREVNEGPGIHQMDKSREVNEGPGIHQMDKTLSVKGARISYNIWEVCGGDSSLDHVPAASKDSVAMLFMFDLTSRCTLNSVITWYQQARKWNQNAIPILVGTKFDDFVQLPVDLQWTIASQARAYAKALNATLFFSSAAYNINVNKIFKFLTAKLFNLPWTLERNLTIGEPIIDF